MSETLSHPPQAPLARASHRAPSGTVTAVTATASVLWAILRRRYREYLTRRLLEALDDRTLHDIGVARSEIDHVARNAADRHVIRYGHLY